MVLYAHGGRAKLGSTSRSYPDPPQMKTFRAERIRPDWVTRLNHPILLDPVRKRGEYRSGRGLIDPPRTGFTRKKGESEFGVGPPFSSGKTCSPFPLNVPTSTWGRFDFGLQVGSPIFYFFYS